jgi:MSHA biogenesis protein MshO
MWQDNAINSQKGFTLIEMIAVILILSVIVVLGTGYVVTFTKGAVVVKSESQLVSASQLTLARITKELRYALPHSFRISNGNRCLSFLPVVAKGYYRNELPDQTNGLPPIGRSSPIAVAPFQINSGRPLFMAVGATATSELYGNNPSSLAGIRNTGVTDITLNGNHRWQRNSLSEVFFITDNANAFCLVDNELRYYHNISPRLSRVNLASSYDLLALSVQTSGNAFALAGGECESCLNISLNFLADDFQLTTQNMVYPHYVP